MRKVAVIFGGKSCENEISVLTGVFVMNVIDREKYTIIPVYIHTDGMAYTSPKMTNLDTFKQKDYSDFVRVIFDDGCLYALLGEKKRLKRLAKIDVALNCCHGGLGEGGGVSALMEWNDIPLASPDLTTSGVFMDKCMTKTIMRGLGVPTVDYVRASESDYKKRGAFLLKRIEGRLKYPVVVKPAHLGSSIGIALANNEVEVKAAIENAFLLDDQVIIEKYLAKKQDVNCAACQVKGEICVSEPEAAFGAGIYSFEEKYVKRKADASVQSGKSGGRVAIKGEIRDKIRAYTRTVYKRMNLRGVVRLDFLVCEKEVYLCEVNTVPGSLAYYLFCERIMDARTFFSDVLEEAVRSHTENKKKIVSTGILRSVSWQGK